MASCLSWQNFDKPGASPLSCHAYCLCASYGLNACHDGLNAYAFYLQHQMQLCLGAVQPAWLQPPMKPSEAVPFAVSQSDRLMKVKNNPNHDSKRTSQKQHRHALLRQAMATSMYATAIQNTTEEPYAGMSQANNTSSSSGNRLISVPIPVAVTLKHIR